MKGTRIPDKGNKHSRERGVEEEHPRLRIFHALHEPSAQPSSAPCYLRRTNQGCLLLHLELLVLDARLVDADAQDGLDALVGCEELGVRR